MGQYWRTVNLTKKETFNHYDLGAGAKLWEQLAAGDGGPGSALLVLLAAMPEARGGGDFDMEENWHGPERTFPEHNCSPGPDAVVPKVNEKGEPDGFEAYSDVAKRTIGRWAGDKIALVGDYGEKGDIQGAKRTDAGMVYGYASHATHGEGPRVGDEDFDPLAPIYKDITADVVRVIEHELNGKYVGEGWKNFKRQGDEDE